jgi:hypothetical protein
MHDEQRPDDVASVEAPYEPPAVEDLEPKDAPLATAPGVPPSSA